MVASNCFGILGFSIAGALFLAPSILNAQTDNSLKKVLDRKVIRIAADADGHPGWMSDASGKQTGYEHDLAELIAKELGADIKVEPVFGSWTKLLDDVRSGTADIVMNQWFLPAEKDIAKTDLWSKCYFDSGLGVMYSAHRKAAPTDQDVAAGKVLIYTDPFAVEVVKRLGVRKFTQSDSEAQYAEAIAKKKVDFVLYDLPVAKHLAQMSKGKVRTRDGVVKGSEQCYAVMAKAGSNALIDAINNALVKIKPEAKKALLDKYGL
jgi:ABC-type amino acid transport substrate-binding protein